MSAVRALLDEYADRLPGRVIDSVDELLRNDEPNEALLKITWLMATEHLAV